MRNGTGTVWYVGLVLTQGILQMSAAHWRINDHDKNKTWFENREDAVARAKVMLARQIEFHKQKLAKLEAMRFE